MKQRTCLQGFHVWVFLLTVHFDIEQLKYSVCSSETFKIQSMKTSCISSSIVSVVLFSRMCLPLPILYNYAPVALYFLQQSRL